ncbi:Imm7 family immunity protein [Roseovarius sp. THAF8]|uniref:Imm7 family immunity protein n=1 Tax=Roseovarius sp. THAF8 TaxID=2587846 RepID=UPI001267DBD8|nr:Imm7 family immunity protein [Roseovarius sp. THAF8]
MIELHGWSTIREAFREQDESDEVLSSAISQIEQAISKLSDFNLAAKLMSQNGINSLLINGNFNHRDMVTCSPWSPHLSVSSVQGLVLF